MVDTDAPEAALFPERVGDRLRTSREKLGLDLADVATKTRVPLRHLVAIEAGNYSALPGPTYCSGFVKAYARAVGGDEVALARDLRHELGQDDPSERGRTLDMEEIDPSRVPSRLLAFTAAGLALAVMLGYGAWRSGMFDPSVQPPSIDAPSEPVRASAGPENGQGAAPAAASAPLTGQVVLTAIQPVWLRIYEAGGKRLFEKQMALNESYTVPVDAANPEILTGRPDALKVTVGGKEVAPLGPPQRTVKDLPISAAALAARPPVVIAPQPIGAATTR
jgi:cytoskeleton protein RodZ